MATLFEQPSDPHESVFRWRMRCDQFERFAEEGVFGDQRAELLEGLVFIMTTPSPQHAWCVDQVYEVFLAVRDRAMVRSQHPLVLAEDSEPQPDIAVVPVADYRAAHPTTALLVIEVSWSSIRHDRGIKSRVYAARGIAEYWIVNLVDRVVEVRTDPVVGGYATVRIATAVDVLTPEAFPDLRVPVARLMP